MLINGRQNFPFLDGRCQNKSTSPLYFSEDQYRALSSFSSSALNSRQAFFLPLLLSPPPPQRNSRNSIIFFLPLLLSVRSISIFCRKGDEISFFLLLFLFFMGYLKSVTKKKSVTPSFSGGKRGEGKRRRRRRSDKRDHPFWLVGGRGSKGGGGVKDPSPFQKMGFLWGGWGEGEGKERKKIKRRKLEQLTGPKPKFPEIWSNLASLSLSVRC